MLLLSNTATFCNFPRSFVRYCWSLNAEVNERVREVNVRFSFSIGHVAEKLAVPSLCGVVTCLGLHFLKRKQFTFSFVRRHIITTFVLPVNHTLYMCVILSTVL